jgi:hypothetical protein
LKSQKLTATFLIVITAVAITNLSLAVLTNNVLIKSTGTISAVMLWDNCDQIDNWKVLSDKEGDLQGNNTIAVDVVDKMEGTGSLSMTWAGTGPNWGGLFYKTGDWNFSQTPVIRMKFKAVDQLPANMRFQIITAPWNIYTYNILEKITTIGEWLVIDIDLRLPLSGFPDLNQVVQIEFSCWDMPIINPTTFKVDRIELLPGPPIPLQIALNPTLSNYILIKNTAIAFKLSVIGGEPPYSYEWFVNNSRQSQSQIFTFAASSIGTFLITAKVIDSEEKSLNATFTVQIIEPTVLPEPRMLHTNGSKIYNDLGQLVLLRGVHSVNFGDSSTGWFIGGSTSHWDEAAVNKTLDTLASWGCNFLYCSGIDFDRLANNTRYRVDGDPPSIGLMDAVKRLLELAYDRGVYVAIGIDNMVLEDTGNPQYVWYWAPNNLDTWVEEWVNISRELRTFPNVLYGMNAEPALSENAMDAYFNAVVQAVQAIRADGDEHIFFYHEDYCEYPVRFDKPATEGGEMIRKLHEYNITNIVYSGHIYRWHGTFGGKPDYFDPHASAIEPGYVDYDGVYRYEDIIDALTYWGYRKILEEYKVPIIMGEGGPAKATRIRSPNTWEKEITCYQNLLKVLNEWNIGYACFWWRDPGTEGAVFSPLIISRTNPTQTDFIANEWGQILINALRTS